MSRHWSSNDNLLERKRALFGGSSAQQTSSTGGLQTLSGGNRTKSVIVTRNNAPANVRSHENNNDDLSPSLGVGLVGIGTSGSIGRQDSNSGLI